MPNEEQEVSVQQIVAVLKQLEVGVPVAEPIRQVGISEQTLYRWKKQYNRLETDQGRLQLQEAKRVWRYATSQGSVPGPPSIAEIASVRAMSIRHGASTSLPTSWPTAGASGR